MKSQIQLKENLITVMGVILTLVIMIFVIMFYSNPSTPNKINVNEENVKEDKSKLQKWLEYGLVVLVIIMSITGVVVGFIKLRQADKEEYKKRYLRVNKELDDEWKLEYGERIYYLKKRDLK